MSRKYLILLLFISAIIVPASAVVITQQPDIISNGQQMTITIRDLPDNATFSLLVEAAFPVQPNSEFHFQMSQFVMPFTLTKSSVSATLTGTSQNRLEVMKGDTIVAVSGKSVDGRYTTTKQYTITTGTYDYFRLSGTSLPDGKSISAQFQVMGDKTGPDNSELTFVVEGVPDGTIKIAALVNHSLVLEKTVIVGSGGPAPTVSPAPAGTQGVQPTGTLTAGQQKTFTSADGKVSVTATGMDYVGLMKTTAGPAPSGMEMVSGPYTMVPQNITFLPLATLVFAIPAGVNVQELILMEERDGAWSDTTFSIMNNTVTSSLNRAGTFALFAPVHPAGTTTEVIPESTYISPTSMTTAQPTPTKAGMQIPIIVGGFLGLLVIGTWRKQR
jgi:hypothetical protein